MENKQSEENEGGLSEPIIVIEGKKFGIRALSWIIDTGVLLVVNNAIGFIVGFFLGLALVILGIETSLDEGLTQCLNLLAGLFLMLVYTTLFEGLFGATIGKLILGMRVVMEDGSSCDLRASVLRGLLRYIDGLFLGLPAYSRMKPPLYQRIGDKSAKTIVVGSKDPFVKEDRDWWWLLVSGGLYVFVVFIVQLISILIVI